MDKNAPRDLYIVSTIEEQPDADLTAPMTLIRPDGYVAWASGPGAADPAEGLEAALQTWCGQPVPA